MTDIKESFEFTLAGKRFKVDDPTIGEQLRGLIGKKITLATEHNVNEDHRFVEAFEPIGFQIELGS